MTKFIALVSGKGGVGKTTTTLNLGYALTELGRKVLLLDANLVTPNLALQLGIVNPKGTLNQFLHKEKDLQEITYLHESGVSIIPASPSYVEYQKTNSQKLSEVFEHLDEHAEIVLIDSPSGLGYEVSQVLKNSDEALIIVNPTLSSVMDALKTIQLAHAHDNLVTGVILNMTNNGRNELKPEEVKAILGVPILANIKHDRKIRKAQHRHAPLGYLYPRSRSAKKLKEVAEFVTLHK
jgi:septum site-determining protein MinD